MDASNTEKTSKAERGQAAAREARLAQALRANLRRRKAADGATDGAADGPAPSDPPPRAADEQD